MRSPELVKTARMSSQRKMREMRKDWPLCKMLQNKQKSKPHTASRKHETSSALENNWSSITIHCLNEKIHSTRQMSKDGPDFFTFTALVNNRPIKFIKDSGSPVTLIPKSQFNRITLPRPLKTEFKDVIDNRIKFDGKTIATVKKDGKRNNLEILVTTRKPIFC